MYSAFNSVFYILTYLLLFSAFISVKKSDNKLNFVVYMPIYIMLMMLFSTFFAGIIDIIGIPVNLVTLGIGNLICTMCISLYILKKGEIQAYYFKIYDLISIIIITIIIGFVAKEQFGVNLMMNYETTDPTRHLRMAQELIESGKLGIMYFASLNNATIISVGLGFLKPFWSYKLFVLADIIMLWLSATLLFSISDFFAKKTFAKIISLVLIVFYVLGYPLNNMVFGFVYLGMGVSICAYLIFVANNYYNGFIKEGIAIVAMMLGCFGIINCYSLFAPFVFISLAIFIAIKFIKNKKLFCKEFFITEFSIFLIPTLFGLYYSFFRLFEGGVSDVGNSLSVEGYIYRDLYSSFIIILPAAIYGLIIAFAKREIKIHHILLLVFGISTVFMFALGLRGIVSSYYFYKMYYMLSLLCFVTAIEGICDLCNKSVSSVISYSLVWVFMAIMNFAFIDDRITQNNVLMSPSSWHSGAFFSIYEFNLNAIKSRNMSSAKVELYEKAFDLVNDDEAVTLLDTTEPIYWFEPFIQRDLREFYCYNFDECDLDDYRKKLEKCSYLVVPLNFDDRFIDFIEKNECVFENSEGYIYIIS